MFTTRSRRRTDTSDEAQAGFSQRRSSLKPIKIGLVENDLLVREGLVALLDSVEDFECLGAWTRSEDAMTALPDLRPDILLLDIRQLQASGLALLQRLPSLSPSTLVFVTTNSSEEWIPTLSVEPPQTRLIVFARLPAMRYGVHGVLSKERGFRSIAEKVRTAYYESQQPDAESQVSSADAYQQPLLIDPPADEVEVGSLTQREWQVIRLIGQGRSNKEIAREMDLGYSTVKNYVSSILKKLQLEGRTQIALLVH